jgi:c-di-GMP-related signal transduction protein
MAALGEREMRRWIRLVVTVGAAEQRRSELVLMGLARARFCELLSDRLRSKNHLFLLGLLSIMDTILEVSMDLLLEQLPMVHEIKDGAPWPEKQPAPVVPTHAGTRVRRVVAIDRTRAEFKTDR